jgi:hypothetical protein
MLKEALEMVLFLQKRLLYEDIWWGIFVPETLETYEILMLSKYIKGGSGNWHLSS